jgi:hypothetical protein
MTSASRTRTAAGEKAEEALEQETPEGCAYRDTNHREQNELGGFRLNHDGFKPTPYDKSLGFRTG